MVFSLFRAIGNTRNQQSDERQEAAMVHQHSHKLLCISIEEAKSLDKYKQKVGQVIAAEQLMREGAEVHADKNIKFLLTSTDNKRYERRVKAEELIEKDTNPDVKKHLLLLYSAAANLLSSLNFTTKDVYDTTRGNRRATLTQY